MLHKGFSLIELMVTIAIVAVLSAIAVPAYNNYMIRSKLNTIVPLLKKIADDSVIYASVHSAFPDASQLGLPTGFAPSIVDNSINEYAALVAVTGDTCGRHQSITFYADTTKIGFKSTIDTMGLFTDLYNINGAVVTVQSYDYGAGGGASETADLINGWINLNTNSSWNYAGDAILSSYLSQSSCM